MPRFSFIRLNESILIARLGKALGAAQSNEEPWTGRFPNVTARRTRNKHNPSIKHQEPNSNIQSKFSYEIALDCPYHKPVIRRDVKMAVRPD